MVLDGRANGEWRVRSLADFPNMYPGTSTEKPRKCPGTLFSAAAGALVFLSGNLGPHPLALEVTGTSTRRKASTRRRSTGCDGGIDKRPQEEGFFASLSPPFPGKTEVSRELN
jgi:hypothetical protein